MWNLKRNDTNEFTSKTERDSDLENKLMVTKGKRWGRRGMNWEFDINRYKLLCKNQICKIQLYSTDNYSRYNKIMMEKNMKKNIYVCMCIYWVS